MNVLAGVYFAAQTVAWTVSPASVTVGDTVELTRRISAEAGVVPQAAVLQSSAIVQPLSAPVVAYTEGSIIVRYEVALFEPGLHALAMPDIELINPNGGLVTVSGDTAWVTVNSVLPQGDSTPAPRPSLGPIARRRRDPGLVLLPVLFVLSVTGLWGMSRRRSKERPSWRSGAGKRVEAPVVQWARAGELRTVVSAVADRLRENIERALPEASRQLSTEECIGVITERRPEWPVRELEVVLRSLDRSRFAPAVPSDIVQLAQRASELSSSLVRQAAEEPED